MKRLLIISAGLGLVLAIGIIAYQGFGAVAQAFAAVGFGVVVVVLVRAVEVTGAGLGWWIVFLSAARVPLYTCVWVRFIREAINQLLPVAQVGGEIAGARVMTFFGIPGALAGAAVLVDMLLQVVTLLVFALIGVGVLSTVVADRALVGSVVAGAALMGLALAGFFAAQRFGGAKLFDRLSMTLAAKLGWSSLANQASLHDNLVSIYANLPRLAAAVLVHLAVWFVGVFEVLVALRLMGFPISYGEALAIESVGQAVRAVGFLMPGALGVQEAGFIAVCALYGIPAPAALALSLVKRVPDITLGLPFLFAWHAHETRALMQRRTAQS
jgi:putative membrane protein